MDSTERIAIPLLLVQTASVIFLWSLDTLGQVSQKIFTLFLAADLLSFALMAHVWMNDKAGSPTRTTTLMVWGLAIMLMFASAFIFS